MREHQLLSELSVMNYTEMALRLVVQERHLCCLKNTEMLDSSFVVPIWRNPTTFRIVYYCQMKPKSNCLAKTQCVMFRGKTAALMLSRIPYPVKFSATLARRMIFVVILRLTPFVSTWLSASSLIFINHWRSYATIQTSWVHIRF